MIRKHFGCCNICGEESNCSVLAVSCSDQQATLRKIFEVSRLKTKNNITVDDFDLSLTLQIHQVFLTAMKEFSCLYLLEATACLA